MGKSCYHLNGYFMKSPQKKNSPRSCNVDTRLQKILANPKPSQPHEPKGNDRTKSIFTDFFLVRVRVNNPHSCDMGARVSEPPKLLNYLNPRIVLGR